MQIKKVSLISILFVFICGLSWAASSPVTMLQSTADQLVKGLQQNKTKLKANPQIVYGLVSKIVIPHIDEARMSRSVVSRAAWDQATPAQRQAFTKEFRTLVMKTYGSAFKQYTDESVRILPLRGEAANSTELAVESLIIRPGKPSVPVSYRLAKDGDEWKVYDFSVDNVSMMRSFRSQFSALSQKGLAPLTQALIKHNQAKQ